MPQRPWSDIERLLLRALRGETSPSGDVANPAVFEEAAFHGVLPLLLHATAPSDSERHHAALELAHRRELMNVLDGLAALGVKALLLKGAALAHTLYPEPWLRPRSDTDLLIPEAERQRVFDLLERQGYRRADSAGGESASAEASFRKEGAALPLDVHWRTSNSPLLAPMFGFGELSARAMPVAALGPHARGLGVVDAVLLAATHRAAHYQMPLYVDGRPRRGDRLIWLYDLHLLVPRLTPAHVSELARHAECHGVAGLCLDALRVTHDAFGTALPQALMDALERAAARPEPSMVFLRGGRRRLLLAEVRALRNWRERWHLLREHAFPPGDYMLRKYGTQRRWLLPALYLRRAFGWMWRSHGDSNPSYLREREVS